MDEKPGRPILSKLEVLNELSQAFRVPASRIEDTDAWRSFSNSGDSLETVELIMALEEELRQ